MLVAPAGYGKTTLAEQWVGRDGRRSAWFTTRSWAVDVAALALGIAKSALSVVPECDVRLRAHMRALPAPAENVQTLAEILGEDLGSWPPEAWLVIDDYHEVASEPRAEDFVRALVASSPVQFLIASRVRPSWVTTKDRLYGEAFELNQTVLAMDNREAADVLVERSPDAASGLVALANGWPAVIGLASVSSAEIEDGEPVPESLYHFFADEVFGALGADVRQGLTTLAVAPVLDVQLAAALLGSASAEVVCAAALDVGLLVERDAGLELHPLARSFLEERSAQLGLRPSGDAAEICLETYRQRREWDAAFDLIDRSRMTHELEDLMSRALDDLLDTARLSTLQRWCDRALEANVDAPIFALARAETMLRHGRHVEAVAHAEAAAAGDPALEFRALCVAGRAAHLASREEDALELYRRAEDAATSDEQLRDTKWGQLLCTIELERPDAQHALGALKAGVRLTDARDAVRAASADLSFQLKLGDIDLEDADLVAVLVDQVQDPLVVSSFQSTYSTALGLACRYRDAADVVSGFRDTIERYRLDFAAPYALRAASLAHAGMRNWASAEESALEALRIATGARDGYAQQLCVAQLMRVFVQQGKQSEALDLELPSVRDPLPSAQAELMSSRALALAAAGRVDDAQRLLAGARGLSLAVEPAVLIASTDAVCALVANDSDGLDRVLELEQSAFRRGGLDILVTAYRSLPELLRVLLRGGTDRERIAALVRKVDDVDLAEVVGLPVRASVDRQALLTPREQEVYGLMIEGLKNREIGRLLFIEESTVKSHTNHIYEKFGVHSRTALIVQAMLAGSRQATSATDSTSRDSS